MDLTSISVYPIKAAAAIPHSEADVLPRGLAGDRRWMVVDEAGRFITQREYPSLALVQPALRPNGSCSVEAPGMQMLLITAPAGDERISVVVWDDRVDAAVAAAEASAWFSDYLGVSCRLAYMDQIAKRPVAAEYGKEGDEVSFADAAPLLLATDASLADLNQRLDQPLAMSNFRPNLTIGGTQPWAEDNWKRLRIGQVEFEVTHPCARCVVTSIDQKTATRRSDGEPLKTLATFRQDVDGVNFGQNLVPRGVGQIRVGDEVEVL